VELRRTERVARAGAGWPRRTPCRNDVRKTLSFPARLVRWRGASDARQGSVPEWHSCASSGGPQTPCRVTQPYAAPRVATTVIPRHLYIHVPFCVRRCSYCDFAVTAVREAPVSGWLDAIEAEMALRARREGWTEPFEVRTVYVGGGTPS